MRLRYLFLSTALVAGGTVGTVHAQQQQTGNEQYQTQQTQQGTQQGTQSAATQSCQRLQLVIQRYENRLNDEWIDVAADAVNQRNRSECARYIAEAEGALGELDLQQAQGDQRQMQGGQRQAQGEGTDAEGNRIIVNQPQPRITVERDSPEITYAQPEPTVNVRQPEPQIIVRQQQPRVHVTMPRPQITIEQPEPQIIVRMPEPDVSVNVPEPEINVSQAQPEVQVQQPEPQVRVLMDEPEVNVRDQQNAQVEVEGGQPVVRRQEQEGEPTINIQQGQPQVEYQAAEPSVEFEMTGEPQVSFRRTGEVDVRVERSGQQQGRDAAQTGEQAQARVEQAGEDQQTGQGQQMGTGERRLTAAGQQARETEEMSSQAFDRLRGDGQMQGNVSSIAVSELIGREVVNLRNQELGTVERVVLTDNRTYLVLSHGGFLGLGERKVGLPLDRISSVRGDDRLVLQGLSEADIEAMPRWDSEAGRELRRDQQVQITES